MPPSTFIGVKATQSGLFVNWVYVGRTQDFSVPTGAVTLPSYHRADVSLRYALSKALTLEGAIDNLFNKRFESFIGFTARRTRQTGQGPRRGRRSSKTSRPRWLWWAATSTSRRRYRSPRLGSPVC